MADDIDRSVEKEQLLLDAAINSSRKTVNAPVATGYCLTCLKPQTDPQRRWCDADCRDIWEGLQK